MISLLFDFMRNFQMPSISDLIMASPQLEVQLTLTIFHTVIWYFLIFYVFYPFVVRMISSLQNKKQFIHYNRETFKKLMMWDIGDVEEEQVETIATIDAVVLQHLIGGMLCLPSALGLSTMLPAGVASAMACHGGISEIGYEVSDMMVRFYEIIFGAEKGRRKNPPSVIFGLVAHHSAACCLVLPMNIYYRDNTYFHEAVCSLQLAAFTAFYLQQYGFTLNVKRQEGLTKMKISISMSLAIIVWTRVIRYGWLWQILLTTLWEDQNWIVMKFCVPPFILMSFFNVGVLIDASAKFAKFVPMSIIQASDNSIKDKAIDSTSGLRDVRTTGTFHGLIETQKKMLNVAKRFAFRDSTRLKKIDKMG